jgi:stearoyl-CoA desaturase (delta-9 desaturase)
MKLMPGSERIFAGDDTDPLDGNVRWAPAKSLWIGAMTATAVALGPPLFSWDALILLVVTSALTLCFGHSVGMHRRLIHNSFECPLWVEAFLRLSRHSRRNGRAIWHDPAARLSRLGATPADVS